ncbi:MAG: HalOD1 output domain-containing protein [Haloarculaceae archaeon]
MTAGSSPNDVPIHYDEQLDVYRTQHDRADATPLSATVVETVASISGTDADELDPLYEAVDPDALEDLFDPVGTAPAVGGVWFHYAGFRVTIRTEGEIEITPAREPESESGSRSGSGAGE